ncbi:MAG: hypothetical protein CUN50_03570 [Candidatus Thermofonsia Clade 1 bacterium]|uniref:Peptidase C-terminal archaeal/bacterial domain-containing protein n=1 Tax=Candidatus Thermofonsia Clade 1 bacterium TaxID=2364210 RepID=A0A2M8PYH8_9CHLR|nr:MAG: hypothetical protein CUN50_03570 [Candidatus Thermofonsia Clade 1 bacterium]
MKAVQRVVASHCAFCLILALLACLALPQPSAAQGNVITYGQTVEGRVTNESFRTVYAFQGQQGEIIDAVMRRLDGNLDPALLLLDSANTLIGRDDDGADALNAALNAVVLPRTETYFLVATRFGQAQGTTTGRYSLRLERIGVAADPALEAETFPLRYDQSAVRELNDAQPQHVYTFAALRGDLITIRMTRISGDLDAVLILADAEGKVLLINDETPDRRGTLDAAILEWRVPFTASYLLVATRFGGESGNTRGAYSLLLSRVPPDQLGLSLERAILLDPGARVVGRISGEAVRRYYLIQGQAGALIDVQVTRTRGNLDPTLALFSADLAPLTEQTEGVRGQSARIVGYRLPRDGEYILIVSRFNAEAGITEGEYILQLTVR